MKRLLSYQPRLLKNRWLKLALVLLAAASGVVFVALATGSNINPLAFENIHPLAIEIDTNANLYPASDSCAPGTFVNGSILNPGATADWVADCDANTDSDPDTTDNIAIGIVPNVTGASGGTGHWNGIRIVDGIAGGDQDIFLTGGKENDTSTWNVGPGTVGSSKYDITQAYLANNQSTLFFGMERRGNNGTTAFDFEFNQVGPASTYIPTRTVGDVLFTFEMQGSGSSGSAVPHYFTWNGTSYVEQVPAPAGLISSINSAPTPAAPWGYVDSKGNWVLGSLPRFEFAEAAAPLSLLPGVNACGGSAFVQVRTRSSSTDNSDLKDTTKIFQFHFGGPEAAATFTTDCSQHFTYNGSGSKNSTGGSTGLTYKWEFKPPSGVTLSGVGSPTSGVYTSTAVSGTVGVILPTGVNSADISVKLTVAETTNCTDTTGDLSVTVFRALAPIAAKVSADANALSVTLAGSATGATTLQWQRLSGGIWVNHGSSISGDSATLTYSNFEADATPTTQSFTIYLSSSQSATYWGKLYQVQFRLHAKRTITQPDGSSLVCEADSAPVIVKKVTAVDP